MSRLLHPYFLRELSLLRSSELCDRRKFPFRKSWRPLSRCGRSLRLISIGVDWPLCRASPWCSRLGVVGGGAAGDCPVAGVKRPTFCWICRALGGCESNTRKFVNTLSRLCVCNICDSQFVTCSSSHTNFACSGRGCFHAARRYFATAYSKHGNFAICST